MRTQAGGHGDGSTVFIEDTGTVLLSSHQFELYKTDLDQYDLDLFCFWGTEDKRTVPVSSKIALQYQTDMKNDRIDINYGFCM